MACTRRERTKSCLHHQCEFAAVSGYDCVDVLWEGVGEGARSFCEVGEDCVSDCQHSFKPENSQRARKCFERFYN
jgi:hypothetical protein